MTKNAVTAAQIRKFAWPKALLSRQSLSVDDCFQVGQIVVEKIQQDGTARLRVRKEWSMRHLQRELGVASAATLTRCVQVYEMARELGLKRPLRGVSASTLFLLAGLPKEIRAKIARRAIKERWPKRRIEAEYVGSHGQRRSGRQAGLACIKALSRCVARPLNLDLDQLGNVEAEKRKAALQQVQQLIETVTSLRKHLGKASSQSAARLQLD